MNRRPKYSLQWFRHTRFAAAFSLLFAFVAPGFAAERTDTKTLAEAQPNTSVHRKNQPGGNKKPVPVTGKSAPTKSEKKVGGDDAAYRAYDQGQYLTALELARKAAEKGDATAHTLIARIYAEGQGVARDLKKAAEHYKQGAELGDTNAAFALGLMLARGEGVKKNLNEAGAMFERAALTGHAEANYNLGLLFLNGTGKPKNEHRGAKHIGYAAEQGLAAAQYDMGTLYQNGVGVEPDAAEASRWIRMAADQGMAAAQFEYAVLLLQGRGLRADEPRAVEFLRKAANNGVVGAQNRLAYVYLEGIGVKPSELDMAKWRIIAKSGGLDDSELDKRLEKLPKKTRAEAQKLANEWIEKSLVIPLN